MNFETILNQAQFEYDQLYNRKSENQDAIIGVPLATGQLLLPYQFVEMEEPEWVTIRGDSMEGYPLTVVLPVAQIQFVTFLANRPPEAKPKGKMGFAALVKKRDDRN